jgi:hypothetical protein
LDEFFWQRRDIELARYLGNGPPPTRNNAIGRRLWWSIPGRTLANVMYHITEEDEHLPYPSHPSPAQR